MNPTTLFTMLPPEDLIQAADLSMGGMWSALRIWLVPILIFILCHSFRRFGG